MNFTSISEKVANMKLDPDSLHWQFDLFRWLFENFGGYTGFLDQELVLPTLDYFADSSPPAIFETEHRG